MIQSRLVRKKWRFLLVIGILVVVICAIWAVCNSNGGEPVYQHKKLSWWLDGYMDAIDPPYAKLGTADAKKREIEEAVRHMGTNAIPTLLEWLRAKDGPLKARIISLTQKYPRFPWQPHPAAEYHLWAVEGFEILGPVARPALPSLIKLRQTPEGEKNAIVSEMISEVFPETVEQGKTNGPDK